MIEIDGSYLEGGGQILRTAISLSAILKKPIMISNIRSNRPKKGLLNQHLTSLNAVSELCNGEVVGNTLNSTKIEFTPGNIKSDDFHFNIGTAGSVTLLSQCIIPVLLCANSQSKVVLEGGTHVMKSPSFEYFSDVFIKNLNKIGLNIQASIEKPGFYPQGGGRIVLHITPSKPNSFDLTNRGSLVEERAMIINSNLPNHILDREKVYLSKTNHKFNFETKFYEKQISTGNSITLIQEYENYYIGSDSLGQIGKPGETVAREAIENLEKCALLDGLDEFMTDQILIYMALTEKSKVKYSTLSQHTLTNMSTIAQITGKSFQHNDGSRVLSYV